MVIFVMTVLGLAVFAELATTRRNQDTRNYKGKARNGRISK